MKKNRRCYTTGSKKSTLFKSIEKVVYPDMFKVDLSKFLAHMIHVTADVLLQATDKPCHSIQTHLGWEGQLNNEICTPFYSLLVKQDKDGQKKAAKKILCGLSAFSKHCKSPFIWVKSLVL